MLQPRRNSPFPRYISGVVSRGKPGKFGHSSQPRTTDVRSFQNRSRKNGFASSSKLRKDQTTDADEIIIHINMLMTNPFSLMTMKNFSELVTAVWVERHFLTV